MLEPNLEIHGLGPTRLSRDLAGDWSDRFDELGRALDGAKVLVLGGAGTIGQACVRQLMVFPIARLDVVDVDENGLARLARDLRSARETIPAELTFMPLDLASYPGLAYVEHRAPFDLVLNFAAVKHVRSEKNVFSVLHMIDTNVIKPLRLAHTLVRSGGTRRFFSVSTDKAAEPANFMGATKTLQEQVVFFLPPADATSMARFPNVAYSSGSLLESFQQRLAAGQPLATPRETRRYFISAAEAARVCLLSQHLCAGRIATPRFATDGEAVDLADAAARFLTGRGLTPVFTEDPGEARRLAQSRTGDEYPVLLTPRDTDGEKDIEIFQAGGEVVSEVGLRALTAVTPARADPHVLEDVLGRLEAWVTGEQPLPDLSDLRREIATVVPGFEHRATGRSLDDRM